jgi:diguanylate cyclase (GGDEF)-like protein
MMDLDDFKQLNDTLGHQWGDRALIEVARIIRITIRELDIAARFGGEEFSVILPQTDLDQAFAVAERIRVGLSKRKLKTRSITASLGISGCPIHATNTEELIRTADEALYDSKRGGKNRTTIAKVEKENPKSNGKEHEK